ncbi:MULTISPECIES: septal ring lytic transglycosylase RlpA family protein [unclassified Sphaerochaeta]|jgi:rare lipoprotein A|uniref:septal ring lytic transglycosylase RlpA family protein n=1 Tax=unclassified Sphaerochaeta TaxID=2637943 RepID=UPI0025E13F24|nr:MULTISPECIES: septal ring lytic transglycosylase RlpA family protein [unclassified Sphaerochaeta]MCK9598353.1 septal ring lytic transglycosylase RlpA family protein [Sphaerochaeta sp.]MDX9824052.1 septal ring lytic transglycosylase RlpA family protein [Sphaerochaeta sp.]
MKRLTALLAVLLIASFALTAADEPLQPGSVIEKGIASWYTTDKSESLTANGEIFDANAMSAAHKSLKFGTIVRVTNLANGKSVDVRINDRGPYVDGRIIDLTPAAAKQIDMLTSGIASVDLTLIFEPEVPESKYNRAGDTGWYQIQVGAYSSLLTAYAQYDRLLNAGLKPYAEQLADSQAVRLTVRWVPAYQLDRTMKALSALGFAEKNVLKKSEVNPYR